VTTLNHALSHWLSQQKPYQSLPAEERRGFAQIAQEKALKKGEFLFREGQESDSVWLLRKGRVHLNKYMQNGQVSTTCVITEGETFCCLPALDHKSYPVNAVAAADALVIRIPSSTFSQWMRDYPSFSQEALCSFCSRLREVECHGCMIFDPVEQRITQVLVTLAKKFGDEIPLTRQEIASLAGTTLETTIRTLSKMKEKKILRSTRGKIILLNLPFLQDSLKQ
jgi:CRP/FNR family transcriptional regulator